MRCIRRRVCVTDATDGKRGSSAFREEDPGQPHQQPPPMVCGDPAEEPPHALILENVPDTGRSQTRLKTILPLVGERALARLILK